MTIADTLRECFISDLDFVQFRDADLIPMMVIDKLRKAGIPVKGVLVFRGIESGSLSEIREMGGYRYVWERRIEEPEP